MMSEHLNIFLDFVYKLKQIKIEIASTCYRFSYSTVFLRTLKILDVPTELRDEIPKPDSLKIKMLRRMGNQ